MPSTLPEPRSSPPSQLQDVLHPTLRNRFASATASESQGASPFRAGTRPRVSHAQTAGVRMSASASIWACHPPRGGCPAASPAVPGFGPLAALHGRRWIPAGWDRPADGSADRRRSRHRTGSPRAGRSHAPAAAMRRTQEPRSAPAIVAGRPVEPHRVFLALPVPVAAAAPIGQDRAIGFRAYADGGHLFALLDPRIHCLVSFRKPARSGLPEGIGSDSTRSVVRRFRRDCACARAQLRR